MIWSEEPKIDQNAKQVYSHPQNFHSHALLSKSIEICLLFRCSNFWKSYKWQLLNKWTPLDTTQALAISSLFAANTHFFSLSRRGGVCVYCSIIVLSVLTSFYDCQIGCTWMWFLFGIWLSRSDSLTACLGCFNVIHIQNTYCFWFTPFSKWFGLGVVRAM